MVATTTPASFRSLMMTLISTIPFPQDMILGGSYYLGWDRKGVGKFQRFTLGLPCYDQSYSTDQETCVNLLHFQIYQLQLCSPPGFHLLLGLHRL